MKKNNYTLLLLILFFSMACSKQKAPLSLAASWQNKNLNSNNELVRSIASTAQTEQCVGDFFKAETLKKEVADYESRITGRAVNGYWKHLDLSTLPIPQANFLKKYGDKIGDLANPESIDYTACTNLVCIFNKIYNQDENKIAGYVHYLWYLKFGHYLSLDNHVPDQKSPTPGIYNDVPVELSSYLYDESELYGFWRLTHILKEPYTSLANLREIQRIPRKANLEGYGEGVCGLALGDQHIRLADGCVNVLASDKDRGFLYIGVIHEMSHILDYSEARKANNYSNTYRSYQQDYLDLVGFTKEEYRDESGQLFSRWNLPADAKTIRAYAAGNPLENFADSLAYYRYDGDEAKRKLSDKQYAWIGSQYFRGKSFDRPSQMNGFLNKYKASFAGEIFSRVLECQTTNANYKSYYLQSRDFNSVVIPTKKLNCLSHRAESMAKKLTAKVQTYELEGCSTIKPYAEKKKWDELVKNMLKGSISSYMNKFLRDPGFLERANVFKNVLESRDMANEAILQCYNGNTQEDLSACYNKKIITITTNKAQELGIPEGEIKDLVDLYAASFSYEDVSEKLFLSYRSILESNQEMLRFETENLWNMCLSMSHSDDEKHVGQKFTPTKGYMVSSLFNCLNINIPDAIGSIVKGLEYEGERIRHPKEELIFYELINYRLIGLLRSYHEAALELERKDFPSIFASFSGEIKEYLLSDFYWVKNLKDRSSIISSCKMESLKKINHLPLYFTKKDAFGEMLEKELCLDVIKDERFQKFIDSSLKEIEDKVFSLIETLLQKQAELKANACIKSFPWKWEKTKSAMRLPRKGCLSLGWSTIEAEVVEELLAKPEIKRFNIGRGEIESRVSALKDTVKTQVEDKLF